MGSNIQIKLKIQRGYILETAIRAGSMNVGVSGSDFKLHVNGLQSVGWE